MKILIISDSHNNSLDNINFKSYDYIIHCGDYGKSLNTIIKNNIIFVKGNCDNFGNNESIIYINDKKIYINHGNDYNVKYSYERLIYRALELNANIVLFGHTHKQIVFYEENILFINPGNYPSYYVELNDNDIILYNNNIEKHIKL